MESDALIEKSRGIFVEKLNGSESWDDAEFHWKRDFWKWNGALENQIHCYSS